MKTLCLPSRNPFSFQQVTRNLRDFSGELESIPALLKKTPPTVIVDAPQAAPDGKGENNAVSAPPPILRIKDLLYGNDANNSYQTVKLYNCSDGHGADQCLKPVVQSVNLVGFKQRVMEIFLGSATNGNGLIASIKA